MDSIEFKQQHLQQILEKQKQLQIVSLKQEFQKQDVLSFEVKNHSAEYLLLAHSIDRKKNFNQTNYISQWLKKLNQCSHPNIIKCYDEFTLDDYYFFQLERSDQSLKQWLQMNQQQNLDDEKFIYISIQLLEGLSYLHSKNLFLQTISLESVWIDRDYQIKYTDFLSLQELEHNLKNSERTSSQLNDYLTFNSPENLKQSNTAEDYKQRDVWSVCILLYVLAGANRLQTIRFNQGDIPYQFKFQFNHEINLILQNSLKRDPSQRPSLEKIISQFKSILNHTSSNEQTIIDKDAEDNFILAKSLFEETQYIKSQSIFFSLVERYPRNDQLLAWLGRTCNSVDNYNECEYWSNQAIKINPECEIAYFNFGNIYKQRKQNDLAIKSFEKVLSINNRNDFAMNNLGLVYDDLQNYEESKKHYLRALEINPQKQNTIYNLGISSYTQQKFDEAESYFEKVLTLNPKHVSSLIYLGLIKQSESSKKDALAFFKKSLSITSTPHVSLFHLGRLYYKYHNYSTSCLCFKEAKKSLHTSSLYYMLASNFYCNVEYEKAIKYYKKSISQDKTNNDSAIYLRIAKKMV